MAFARPLLCQVSAIAEGPLVTEILEDMQRLSRPFGTNIVIQDGVGTITIGETSTTSR